MAREREPVYVRTARILRMIQALRARPRRVPELAAEFGVHPRKIYRDLQVIGDLERGLDGHDGEYSLPSKTGLALEFPEALAIYSATRLLVNHARMVDANYASVLRKLVQQVPEPARSRLAAAEDWLPARREKPSRTLELVARAWFESKVLRIDYRRNPFKETTKRHDVEAYHYEVSPVNLAGYVIGHSRRSQGIRTFKLDRIENPILLNEDFEIPPTFDPVPHLQSSWGILSGERFQARLWCDGSIAMQVKEFDNRGVEIDRVLDDGGLVFSVPGARTERGEANELKSWIESWGPKMEVFEPTWLREQVLRDLRDAISAYEEEQ